MVGADHLINQIDILDPAGIVISTMLCHEKEITTSLPGDAPGLYFIRIETGNSVIVRKILRIL